MRVAIVQSCYVPWKGYFDLIRSVDHFILLDDVQYSRGDFRNRNRIKTARGPGWITIPLRHSGTFPARILDMRVAEPGWRRSHRSQSEQAYRASPGWTVLRRWLDEHLERATSESLSEVNELLLRSLCTLLGIATPISRSLEHGVARENPTERVVELCRSVDATCYVSGPSAKDYLEPERFRAAGIALEYFDYAGYVDYPQPHGPFLHNVSILDAVACLGADALRALERQPAP